jgi:O-antigen/teichoic acid export membrane protein
VSTEETRIARGTLAQQTAQVVGALSMLVALTVVGRELPLDEFGVYGLLITISAYLMLLQTSIEGSSIRAIAAARAGAPRERLVSLALVLYVLAGIVAGTAIAGGGLFLVEVLPIPARLEDASRSGVIALGAVTAAGWPFKVFQDFLRGSQRFLHASIGEVVAHLTMVGGMVALVTSDAPLWALIALGGSLPVLTGVGSFVVLAVTRTLPRLRRDGLRRDAARDLLGFSAYLSVMGVADILIYSLDRVILAAFTSTATVGLYEGAARPHHLVRQLHGTLSITVFPVASAYHAEDDRFRLRELLLRGTRYVHAAVVPLTVVLLVLAGPILDVWLGHEFREAGLAMGILTGYWLLNGATGVGGSMLGAAGQIRWMTAYGCAIAIGNLVCSVAFTAWLGLEGVMIGTVIPYVVGFPFFLRKAARTFGVPVREMVAVALMPAWAVGAGLAAVLVAARLALEPDTLVEVAGMALVALAAAYATWAALFFGTDERRLVRSLLRREPRADAVP